MSTEHTLAENRYTRPVADLLAMGDPLEMPDTVYQYSDLGITTANIPELLRMLTDDKLRRANEASPNRYAPVHAWRALGELRAEAAIKPLIGMLRFIEEDDEYIRIEFPLVFGLIGPAAITPLGAYLENPTNWPRVRAAAASSIQRIGEFHPGARSVCVTVLATQLQHFERQDVALNTMLALSLIELCAVESAPVIEAAFAAEALDETYLGDWEDVQIELGLLDKRITAPSAPIPFDWVYPDDDDFPLETKPTNPATSKSTLKNKKKRKEQKKARKRNRKK